jgi:hypothetical protein
VAPEPPLAPPAVPVPFVAPDMGLVPSATPRVARCHRCPSPHHPQPRCPRRPSPSHTRLRRLHPRHARPHHHLHATPSLCGCSSAVRCLHRRHLLRLLHQRCL